MNREQFTMEEAESIFRIPAGDQPGLDESDPDGSKSRKRIRMKYRNKYRSFR